MAFPFNLPPRSPFEGVQPGPPPVIPPAPLMAQRQADEEGFRRWFGSVSQMHGLDPDPDAPANKGIQYRQMYAMGLEPEAVPGEAQRLLELERTVPPPPDPDAVAQRIRTEIVGLYADPRFNNLPQAERVAALSSFPGYEGLSPEEEAYMQQSARDAIDAGATRYAADRNRIPLEILEPGWKVFGPEPPPVVRTVADIGKQTIRGVYSGFTKAIAGGIQTFGVQGLEGLAQVGYGLRTLQDWSEENIQRRLDPAFRRDQRMPTTIVEDVAKMHEALGYKPGDRLTPETLAKFAEDIRVWSDAQKPWEGPLSDMGVPGRVWVYANQGVGAMLYKIPEIMTGARLLGSTLRFFVTEGALAGSSDGFIGAFWGGVHGALIDRFFKWGQKIPAPGPRAATTGALFAGMAMYDRAPPEDVLAQFGIGWGLGQHGILKHQRAVRENLAAIVNEAEREAIILEETRASEQRRLKLPEDTFVDPKTGQIGWAFAFDLPTRTEQIAGTNRVAAYSLENQVSIRTAYMKLAERAWDWVGMPKPQQHLLKKLADAQARSWAENHLRNPDEWYLFNSWTAGIEGGNRPGDMVLTSRARHRGPRWRTPRRPGLEGKEELEQTRLAFSPPPENEPVSDFKRWREVASKEVQVGMRRKLKRGIGVGAPRFALPAAYTRETLPDGVRLLSDNSVEFTFQKGPNKGKHFVVGAKDPDTWMRLVDEYITDPAEFERAFKWYEDTEPVYRRSFGVEDWKLVAVLSYAAQQMKGPVASFGDVLTAISQELGGAVRRKKGGLAGPRLKAILANEIGTMGAKLHDFSDSLDLKSRRTFWLDHELGGRPFVGDVWTLRDLGFLDGKLALGSKSGLRKQLTDEQLAFLDLLPLDFKKSPTASPTQYEYTSEWGNRLTNYLNDVRYRGRNDWEPRNAQAVGWVAVQKSVLARPEYPIDAIMRNSYRVSLEIASDFAPYAEEYNKLTPHQQAEVTSYALNWALPRILDMIGYPLRATLRIGTGHWQEFINQSGWIDIVGPKWNAEAVGRILGYILQQHSVYVSREMPKGKTFGLRIREGIPKGRLEDDATTKQAVQRLFALDPRVNFGADRIVEGANHHGFRVLFPRPVRPKKPPAGSSAEEMEQYKEDLKQYEKDKKNLAEVKSEIESWEKTKAGERPKGKLFDAIEQVEREFGLQLDVEGFNSELTVLGNNWSEHRGAKNNGYLEGLEKITGVRGLRRKVVSELAPALRTEIGNQSRFIRRAAIPGREDLFGKGHSELGVDVARAAIRRMIPARLRPARQGEQPPGPGEEGWRPRGGFQGQQRRTLESRGEVPPDIAAFAARVAEVWNEGGQTQIEPLSRRLRMDPEELKAALGQAARHGLLEEEVRSGESRWYPTEGQEVVGPVLGQIEFPASHISVVNPAIIRLFEGAHVGTAVHEMGHLLRVTMTPTEIRTAETFYGVRHGQWESPQEERFAQDFERYLATGEAADKELGPVYSKLGNVLRNVYKKAAPHMLDQGILNEASKAQFERWLSPERARSSNPAAIGREWAAPMTLAELQWQQQRKPLLDVDRIFESFQGQDGRVEIERYADNLNLTKIRNADDVVSGIKAIADVVGMTSTPRIEKETWREATQFAEEQGITLKEYLENNDGRLPDQKELTAARAMLYAATREVQRTAKIAKRTMAPPDLVAFERAALMQKMIRDKLSGEITKIARAFGSLRMIMEVPPEETYRNSLLDLAVESAGGAERLIDAATRIADIENEGGAISRQLDAELGGSLSGAVMELWIMGLISGAKTQARNLLSNTAMTAFAAPEAFLAAGIGTARTRMGQAAKFLIGDRAPRWLTNQDRVFYGEALARTYGFLTGGWTGLRLAGKVLASDDIWNPITRASRVKNIPAVGTLVDGMQKLVEAGKALEVDPRLISVQERQSKLAEIRRGQFSREAFGLSRKSKSLASQAAGSLIDEVGAIVRAPGMGLEAGDAFFRSIGFAQEMHSQAWRRAAREHPEAYRILDKKFRHRVMELSAQPTREMLDAAELNAGYMTFTNPLGPIGRGLIRMRSEAPALRLLVPFMLAPSNIVARQYERTPAPILPVVGSRRVKGEIKAGGAQGDTALARMTFGSMILAVFAHMAANGMVTGDPPADPALTAAWLDVYQPRSIFWGDVDTGQGMWIGYEWMEPYASLFAIGADVGQTDKGKRLLAETVAPIASMLGFTAKYAQIAGQLEPETLGELAEAGVKAIVTNFTSKLWWRSISELANMMYDPERHYERWRNAYVRTAVPRVIANWEQSVDPAWRDAHTMADTLRSQIPGWSKGLALNRNIWGDPLLFSGGLGPDMVSPIYTREAVSDPLYLECVRLKLPLRNPHRNIAGVELNEKEYEWLKVMAGTPAKAFLQEVVTDKLAVNPRKIGEYKSQEMRVPGVKYHLTRDANLLWSQMNTFEQKSVILNTLRKSYNEWREIEYYMILDEDPSRATDPIAKELQVSRGLAARRGLMPGEGGGVEPRAGGFFP